MSSKKESKKKTKKKNFQVSSAKEKMTKCAPRRIPKAVLEDTLKKLRDPNDAIWSNIKKSCLPVIEKNAEHRPFLSSEMTTKLKTARQCLLRRDWANLSRTLTTNCFKGTQGHAATIFPIFAKYAALCLLHKDVARLDIFLKTILASKEPEKLMAICRKYLWTHAENIEET